MKRIKQWLVHRWQRPDPALLQSYRAVFSGEHGERVLADLIDSVYATVCNSDDPMALAAHNARRKVVHEILQSLDIAEHPQKYNIEAPTVQEEIPGYAMV